MKIVSIILIITLTLTSLTNCQRWKKPRWGYTPPQARESFQGRGARFAFQAANVPSFQTHLNTKLTELQTKAASDPSNTKWSNRVTKLQNT